VLGLGALGDDDLRGDPEDLVGFAGSEEEDPVVVGHDEVIGADHDVADPRPEEAIRRARPAAERADRH
jgi:hypothetical protein